MKKTINIHLGRQLFTIEEDAYETLQNYLNRLERSFANEEGITDIMEDIEMRFAELLKDYLGPTSQVVTINEVKRAIESLGEPEEIQEEEPMQSQGKTHGYSETTSNQKRLYRDTENGMLGGVSAGLAAYLNIDPVIVRAAFVIFLFLGFGFLLYIILWAIIPSAKTPSDRLRMKGKPVNIDNLKEEVEKAAIQIKDDAMNAAERIRNGTHAAAQQTRNLIRLIAKIIGVFFILGACIWLVVFSLIVSGIIDFVPMTGDQEFASMYEFLQLVTPANQSFSLIWNGILMVGFAGPLLSIVLGVRMVLGNLPKYFKIAFIVLPVIIAVGLIFGLIGGLKTGRDYEVYAEIENQHLTFNTPTLTIEELPVMFRNRKVIATGGVDFFAIENGQLIEHGISIKYRQSNDSLFHVSQIYSAHGVDRATAQKRSLHITNNMRIENDKLYLDPFYKFPKTDGFRNQEIEVIIEVPKGKTLKIKNYTITNPDKEYNGKFYKSEDFLPYDESDFF
jgi:phage shock protein PspC (stress-responsive transcriptional regulator)